VGCFFQIPMWFLSRSVYFTGWWWGRLVVMVRSLQKYERYMWIIAASSLTFAVIFELCHRRFVSWHIGGLKIQWLIMVYTPW
jgi:hypothetical protein